MSRMLGEKMTRGATSLALAGFLLLPACQKKQEVGTTPKAPASKTEKNVTKADKAAKPGDMLGGLQLEGSKKDPAAMVVNVDGKILTEKDLGERVDKALAMQGATSAPPEVVNQMMGQVRPRVIESYVSEAILEAEADRQKIVPTEQDIDKAIEDVRKRVPQGTTLEQVLAQQGKTLDDVKKDPSFAMSMKLQKLLDQQTASVPQPTEEEIQARYDQDKAASAMDVQESVRAKHVLIKCDKTADEATRKQKKEQADKVRKELVDGADFAATALKYSDCPSKEQGGDLGKFTRDQMVAPFAEAAFTQPLNEIGPVVETDFGYHIIQVLEKEQARTKPLEEVKEDISKMLWNEKRRPVLQTFVKNLRDKAKITYGEGYAPAAEPPPGMGMPAPKPAPKPGEPASEPAPAPGK